MADLALILYQALYINNPHASSVREMMCLSHFMDEETEA